MTTLVIDWGADWQWAYALFAAMRVALIGIFIITRREWRITETQPKRGQRSSAAMSQTLRLPIVWLMVLIFVAATGTELVAGQFANSFLIESRSIDPKVAGAWVGMYWGSLTASRFLVGFVINRISSGMFLRLNMAVTMIGAGLLWSNLGAASSLLGLALIGFSVAPFAPIMFSDTAWPRRSCPYRQRGWLSVHRRQSRHGFSAVAGWGSGGNAGFGDPFRSYCLSSR